MKLNLALIFLATALLAGCNGATGSKSTEKKVDKTNDKIAALNDNLSDLRAGGISVLKYGYGCTLPDDLTESEMDSAIEILEENSRLASDILNVANDSDVTFYGSEQDIRDIKSSSETCIEKIEAL